MVKKLSRNNFISLIIVSGLWGSSFIFLKLIAPVFGPLLTSSFRLVFAGLFMLIYFLITKKKASIKKNLKWYLIIGVLNSSIPFTLYAFAALYIPANLSVILNSTAPMFGMIFGYLIIGDKFSVQKVTGLLIGTLGVAVITSVTFVENDKMIYLALFACIGSAILYGFSGTLVKKYTSDIDAEELTFGSMLLAGIVLIPFAVSDFSQIYSNLDTLLLLVLFGIFCTAVPYLLFYRLLKEIGPVKALMVTYLMPVFGIIWSVTFLGEVIELRSIVGLFIIFIGIYFITTKKRLVLIKK